MKCNNCEQNYDEETQEGSMRFSCEAIQDFIDVNRRGLARHRSTVYLCAECAKTDISPIELFDLSREANELLGWVDKDARDVK